METAIKITAQQYNVETGEIIDSCVIEDDTIPQINGNASSNRYENYR